MNILKFFCSLMAVIILFNANQTIAGELMEKVMANDITAVKKLLAAGADVNEKDKSYGSTPLMMASSYEGYEEMVELLLNHGADPNIQDKTYGNSAFIIACGVSQKSVEMMLAKGADIKLKNKAGTSVFTSCITGILMGRVTFDLAKLLLEKGADINEAPVSGMAEGYTCLMMAARNGRMDVVKFLIQNGADINAAARDGSTALSLAQKKKDTEMVKLLKSLGAKG